MCTIKNRGIARSEGNESGTFDSCQSSGWAYLSGLWWWVHLWRRWGGKHNRSRLPRGKWGLQETRSRKSHTETLFCHVWAHVTSSRQVKIASYVWTDDETEYFFTGSQSRKKYNKYSWVHANIILVNLTGQDFKAYVLHTSQCNHLKIAIVLCIHIASYISGRETTTTSSILT